jgi:hypothetical protein
MPDRALLFCAAPPLEALDTLGLLQSPFHAVWFPPDARRAKPTPGDRLWVLWRRRAVDPPTLLGTGRIRPGPGGELLWTNRIAPGIRDLARQFGCRGGSNMAFLRLDETRLAPANIALPGLGGIPVGLCEATDAHRALLEAAFRLTERRANRLQGT